MSDSEYVTNAAWRDTAGRPDAIDDVADQFERRRDGEASGAVAFWTAGVQPAWPSRPRELRLAG